MSNKPHDSNPFSDIPRCGAKTRRGPPCKCPAMKNGRCRLHGGLSTGPRTEEGRAKCGNWKHGLYSELARFERERVSELLIQAAGLVKVLDNLD